MASGTVDDVGDETEIEMIDVDLDWPAPAAIPSATPGGGDEPRRRPSISFDPRWLIAVAVVAYLVWLLGFSGGDGAEDAIEPAPAPAPTTTAPPEETLTVDDDRAALAGDPSLDLAAAIATLTTADYDTAYLEMQVNPFGVDVFAVVKQFETVPGEFRFAYIGVDGRPVVIDTGSGEVRSVIDETPMAADSGFAVLNDAGGVIGLGPESTVTAVRVASDLSVVRRPSGELLGARILTSGEVEYGIVGEPETWATLPGGAADFWLVPAVGIFVTPSSGGVFELTPDGVISVTPFEMVSTNGTRWIEIRRVAGPDEYWVVDRSGDSWLLDRDLLDLDGGVSISPDGQWVFVADGFLDQDFPTFYGVETGEVVLVESRADRNDPVWAPDSSFVAELDPTRNCIWINYLTGLNGCIVLDKLKVPSLDASALVVY